MEQKAKKGPGKLWTGENISPPPPSPWGFPCPVVQERAIKRFTASPINALRN